MQKKGELVSGAEVEEVEVEEVGLAEASGLAPEVGLE